MKELARGSFGKSVAFDPVSCRSPTVQVPLFTRDFFPVTFTLYSISSHSQPGKIADGEGRDKDKSLSAF